MHGLEVTRWWQTLSAAERASLSYVRAPRRVFVRFVEPGATADDDAPDFYEHLVNHEVFLDDGTPRHICSAAGHARDAIRAGVVRASFRCPLAAEGCPMRALLAEAPGRDVRFSLRAVAQ